MLSILDPVERSQGMFSILELSREVAKVTRRVIFGLHREPENLWPAEDCYFASLHSRLRELLTEKGNLLNLFL